MTNLEWLHSLEPKELGEWFAAEHVDTRAERTCKVGDGRSGWWICSECGGLVNLTDRFCPSCGRRVVE